MEVWFGAHPGPGGGYWGPTKPCHKWILPGYVLLFLHKQSCGNHAAQEWINAIQMLYFKSIPFRLQEIFKALYLDVHALNGNTAV